LQIHSNVLLFVAHKADCKHLGSENKEAACTCDNVNVSYVRRSVVSQFVLRAVQRSHEISSVVSVHLCTSQMTELELVLYVCKHWFSNYSLVYIFYIVSKSYKQTNTKYCTLHFNL